MGPARILRVGGREADRLTLETILRDAGLPDVFLASPAEALSILAGGTIDVLVLDLMQASADIIALLKAAAMGTDAEKCAVIVTAPVTANDRIQACLQRGAEDYINTPFDSVNPQLVARRIELCVQRRQLRDFGVHIKSNVAHNDETAVMQIYSDASNKFVPREFLDHLERRSLTDVQLGDHVQRSMTVFFSDIRGFTALSEKLTPQENFNFLNSYLKQVTPIIRDHRGFVDKYIGDAVMALFPDRGDALSSALAIQRQVVEYNQQRKRAGYVEIKIGIGMHHGDLILGTIGEEERMQTTVIADAVNVASRIEGLTKTFGVDLLVSGTVVDGLRSKGAFKLRHLGMVKAKGKTQSVEIYECFDNDPDEMILHKQKTMEAFVSAMSEFQKGMFLTAGRIFSRIAELNPKDTVAAYYRDSCSLTAVRGRGSGPWDGAEKIEVK